MQFLFVVQGGDGIHLRSAGGGDCPEDDANQRSYKDRDDGGESGDGDAVVGKEADRKRNRQTNESADKAAAEGYKDGFSKKLKANLAIRSPDSFANADLTYARAYI